MQSKSQVSAEYMLIMGFAAIMIIPLMLLYYTYVSSSRDEIITSQINQIATRIVDAAESVHFLGEPSQTTIRIYMPGQVVGASVDSKEVLFNASVSGGISEIVKVSSVNLTGSLPKTSGRYTITLKASGKNVEISYK